MDQDALKIDKQPRWLGFLVAAAFVLSVGILYVFLGFILAGAFSFQGIVVATILLITGSFVALWWFSGSVQSDPEPLEAPTRR